MYLIVFCVVFHMGLFLNCFEYYEVVLSSFKDISVIIRMCSVLFTDTACVLFVFC